MVYHRIFENELRVGKELRHVDPIEVPVGEVVDEILDAAWRAPVVLLAEIRLQLHDPVEQLRAVRELADRIKHEFFRS